MKRRILFGVFCAAAMSATAATASSVVVDFNGPDQSFANDPVPFSEDGFLVDGSGVDQIGVLDNQLFTSGIFNLGETIIFTREDGGFFQFVSFDQGRFSGFTADEVQLLGFNAGIQVADFGVFAPTFIMTVTISDMLAAVVLDELRIVGTGNINMVGPIFDNFVFETVAFSEVPLPAALPLFLAGLGGLGAMSRRKMTTA